MLSSIGEAEPMHLTEVVIHGQVSRSTPVPATVESPPTGKCGVEG